MRCEFNPTSPQRWLLSLMMCFLLGGHETHAESSVIYEYQVKATFLFYFGKFIKYPDKAFSSVQSEMVLCVLGDDPFQGSLDILIKGETTQERPIKIRYLDKVEETRGCHTLFISQSEQARLANIISHIKQKPILTVSDIKDFVTHGGMIEFYRMGNKVRFFIEPTTAIEAGLKISARLLQLSNVLKK